MAKTVRSEKLRSISKRENLLDVVSVHNKIKTEISIFKNYHCGDCCNKFNNQFKNYILCVVTDNLDRFYTVDCESHNTVGTESMIRIIKLCLDLVKQYDTILLSFIHFRPRCDSCKDGVDLRLAK